MNQNKKLDRIQLAPQPRPTSTNWLRMLVFHAGLLVMVGFAIASWQKIQQEQRQVQDQLVQAKAEQELAIKQNRELFQATQQLKDPQYLEDVARRDYYYTKPGEIIFELGSDAKTAE